MNDRIISAAGSPRECGVIVGRRLRPTLADNIARYIAAVPGKDGVLDVDELRKGALPWLLGLPRRFVEEFEGIAEGSGLDLQVIAEWEYVEMCVGHGCSSLFCRLDGNVWVGRNNDAPVPDMWGYVMIKEIDGRIPAMGFCVEGTPFMPAGVNRQRLWVHMNGLRADDPITGDKPHMPPWVLVTEALETCVCIDDVDRLLGEVDRDNGSIIGVVDGKTNEGVIFECGRARHDRRPFVGDWTAANNHRTFGQGPAPNPADEHLPRSHDRTCRIDELMAAFYATGCPELPRDLISTLADDGVERRDPDFASGYSNVACPATGELWYTFGGHPSASAGNWQRLDWPWVASDRGAV